jgi:hypothetical protein
MPSKVSYNSPANSPTALMPAQAGPIAAATAHAAVVVLIFISHSFA